MGSEFAWFLVVAGGGIAVVAANAWAVKLQPGLPPRAAFARAWAYWALAAAALVLLCLLLKLHAYDTADQRLVALLAETRSANLESVFDVVTTMGDVVPTLLIATGLAMAFHHRTRAWQRALVLPVAIIVQVGIQFLIERLFHDPVLSDIDPHLSIGGAGPIPSGSIARLSAIFLIAMYLWQDVDPTTARRLRLTGAVLTVVELVSRLYLGRHFVSDIAGGLLLGILLASGFAWCIALASARGGRPSTLKPYARTGRDDRRGP